MFRRIVLALGMLGAVSAANAREPELPIDTQVMVLGVFHFANPGRDVVNIEATDVLTERRQSEIAAITEALAVYAPDRIFVERVARTPDLKMPSYREYSGEALARERDETVQIGYRLAHRLGHEAVYGFDEQAESGEPDYFPLGKVQEFARANGTSDRIEAIFDKVRAVAAQQEQAQKTLSLPQLLLAENDDAKLTAMHNIGYNGLLTIGGLDDQPGAELNAMWFLRNAKMYAKMGLVAEPGERVLLIVGSGHKFWLDHLSRNTPGYAKVDPKPYLEMAERIATTE